jgi:hypothetical protein
MDTLRGTFGPDSSGNEGWDETDEDGHAPALARELPPHPIGQDERRMQVRAYNHWASMLGERMFPDIEDLDPLALPDFGPNSVLLDFSYGIENRSVRFLAKKLAEECGTSTAITCLADVPARSLLSRITDHYMQILANQVPIGFEAEFVNHAGIAILYRGILLPFSSDDESIDFIYGGINWKEMADQLTADELLLEIDQALELEAELEDEDEAPARAAEPVTDWADSPAHEAHSEAPNPAAFADIFADFTPGGGDLGVGDDADLPDFSQYALDADDEDYDEDEGESEAAGYSFASLANYIEAPAKKAIDLTAIESLPLRTDQDAPEPEPTPVFAAALPAIEEPARPAAVAKIEHDGFADDLPEDAGLYDCLAAARALAYDADISEDRSRTALYAAVSRACDFSLAALAAPDDYAELIADAGLTAQERALMTPVVKLVFAHDYDKTRLTEYAAVLTHAHRLQLTRGSLADFPAETEGGVKAVVKAERRLRRE